jgi:hypothetical protein
VAADLDLHAELHGAALDHTPGVNPMHRRGRERVGAPDGRAEQGALGVPDHVGGAEVFIEEGFELVMGRHFVALAAFLVEPDPNRDDVIFRAILRLSRSLILGGL